MSLNRGLGRGLSSLLGENFSENSQDGDLCHILLTSIEPGIYQPRKSFDKDSLYELADSIKKNGLLQPIVVVKQGQNYVIIAGERRWRASKIAGLHSIPAIVRDIKTNEMLEYALIENIQRENLNIIEEAEGYLRLMGDFGYTQEELSAIVNKSRSHVANILRLNTLPSSIKKKIIDGLLSMGHGRALVGHQNAEEIASLIVEKGLNVRQTEALVRSWNGQLEDSSYKNSIFDSDFDNIILALSQKFEVKVRIENVGSGGKVTFHYDSLEQLDNLLSKLTGY
jgi:ParB family transcriptional regulator, chromosome partitioning protein